MKIILFGSGTLGQEALKFIGEKNIYCFCDNDKSQVGRTKWNKEVISFDKLKCLEMDYMVIICAHIWGGKVSAIMKQLGDAGIQRCWIYQKVKEEIQKFSFEKRIEYLQNIELLYQSKCKFYELEMQVIEKEKDYIKRNIDITKMKRATGRLRERQLRLVNNSADFFEEISELNIFPFLDDGNLIGYIRHNGFIPWDDDIDFGLIRKDYEKLKKYCYSISDDTGTFVKKGKKYFFKEYWDVIHINVEDSNHERLGMDFFVYDYYRDDYDFNDYDLLYREIKEAVYSIKNNNDKIKYVREKYLSNVNIVDISNTIYMGLDSQVSLFNLGKMMSKEELYPLKKIEYEGRMFWIPNKPEEFCSYKYENIWELPDHVGIPKHFDY